MAKNDIVLLDNLLVDWRKSAPSGLSKSESFELFAAEQILKDYDLSTDELNQGRVGGGGDGGVDGFYTFVNDDPVDDDFDIDNVKKNPRLALYVIQAREKDSFQESVIDKVQSTMRNLLNLDRTISSLRKLYCESLVKKAELFRDALVGLNSKHPSVEVVFVLATKGDTSGMHPAVIQKGDGLRETFEELLSGCDADVRFLGAKELLEEARKNPSYTLSLRFVESAISVESSYIVLANLHDYFDFVTDDGSLRKYIFESNVRDFQGNVEVNNDIKNSLEQADAPEFWWLNNGVTIIASKASISGKVLALDDVQIVNGLQTSVRIFEYLRDHPDVDERRSLLCRVIVTDDPATRDRIIKATNFQTSVSAASLRATDPIQRNIEEYLLAKKWYYDRRKNFYKNLGRPADRIIRVPYLAQAVMAMALSEPDNSRARPTSLIKKDDEYSRIFDETIDLETYHWCATTMRRIESFLSSSSAPGSTDEQREFPFHLAMLLVMKGLGKKASEPADLQPLLTKEFTTRQMAAAMRRLVKALRAYDEYKTRPLDRIAKSRDFVDYLLTS